MPLVELTRFPNRILAELARGRLAAGLFVLGGALFGFSLYAMALGGPRWLGAVTPFGGAALILGWLVLAIGLLRR